MEIPSGEPLRIEIDESRSVSGLWLRPSGARAALVLAHGAGAGMTHPSMDTLARDLAEVGVATLRYQFPFTEAGSKRPDPPPVAHATVRAAVATAFRLAPDLAMFAGGRSFGGRMTSQAHASAPLPRVLGLIFFAFPLHPANRPSADRAKHLLQVHVPMLFLQGTRDALADLQLLQPVCEELGNRATLKLLPDADHSFHVLARSGRTDPEVRREMANGVGSWLDRVTSTQSGG